MANLFWFRRDRRLGDNLALNQAVADSADGVALFYAIDAAEFSGLMPVRQHSLLESLRALNQDAAGALAVRTGSVVESVLGAARELSAAAVYATRAHDTNGVLEQNAVSAALRDAGIELRLVDSNYAVAPGSVVKPDGTAYRVYTPFYKAWLERGWLRPVERTEPAGGWAPLASEPLPEASGPAPFKIRAGEAFALRTFERFIHRALEEYDEQRNRADLPGTSHLSHALAHGEIHPRTILARLGDSPAHTVFRKEIAWREFYGDVLFRNQHTLTEYYEPRFAGMRYDSGATADERLAAWQQGKTGYPMVDAAMRQLLATGWMHNRARMIVASFLVKDLHLEWQQGADWFERHLTDFDPASNAHGWQWTAGCGTDASPYFRVFNPILQGLKFDPDGNYVREFVPELRHISGAAVHEPWLLLDGLTHGYPHPIVDHSTERDESLRRLEEIKVRTDYKEG